MYQQTTCCANAKTQDHSFRHAAHLMQRFATCGDWITHRELLTIDHPLFSAHEGVAQEQVNGGQLPQPLFPTKFTESPSSESRWVGGLGEVRVLPATTGVRQLARDRARKFFSRELDDEN